MRRYVAVLAMAALLALFSLSGAAGAKEQKVTITMREMSFTPNKSTLQAGVKAEIVLVNKGKVKHEFMVYAVPKAGMSRDDAHEWAEENSYFKGLEVKVEGGGIEVEGMEISEIEVAAGKSAEVKFTPKKTGAFEIGCFVEGHYEAGMKGTLVIK